MHFALWESTRILRTMKEKKSLPLLMTCQLSFEEWGASVTRVKELQNHWQLYPKEIPIKSFHPQVIQTRPWSTDLQGISTHYMLIPISPPFKTTKDQFYMVISFLFQVLRAMVTFAEPWFNNFWIMSQKGSKLIRLDLLDTYSQDKNIKLTFGRKETLWFIRL